MEDILQSSATTKQAVLHQTRKTNADLVKRTLIAIPAFALLVSVIYFHGAYAKIIVLLIHLLCVHEIISAMDGVAKPIRSLSYGFTLALLPAYEFLGGQSAVTSLLVFSVMLVLVAMMISQRSVTDGLYTILPMLYPGLLFASVYDILSIPSVSASQFVLILAFGCAMITDTFAYLGGSAFGRHKLMERVSPNKTVEGALCGLVSGILFVFLFGSHFQLSFGVQLNPLLYLAWGALLSLFSQVGDLVESYLKRWFGKKDFGTLLGPHGGMMDRLDSFLFIAPIASLFRLIYLF